MAKVNHLAMVAPATLAYVYVSSDQAPVETAMTVSRRSRWSQLRSLTTLTSGRSRGDDTSWKTTGSFW